jgi:hypothetical protein
MSLLSNHPHSPARTAQATLLLLLLSAAQGPAGAQPTLRRYRLHQWRPAHRDPRARRRQLHRLQERRGRRDHRVARQGQGVAFQRQLRRPAQRHPCKPQDRHPRNSIAYADGKLTVAAPRRAPDRPRKPDRLHHRPAHLRQGTGEASPARSTDGTAPSTAAPPSSAPPTTAKPSPPASPWCAPCPPSPSSPRDKTSFDLQETYGKLTSPVIPPTTPATPAAVTETSIFHADAERDEYFSARFFALGQTAFDHNYSQGLNLQQIYGGGIGWTALKSARQELDLKASMQYEKQSFQTASNNEDLIGSTISETYHRTLPKKSSSPSSATSCPSFNITNDYSANVSGTLVLPVYKRLSSPSPPPTTTSTIPPPATTKTASSSSPPPPTPSNSPTFTGWSGTLQGRHSGRSNFHSRHSGRSNFYSRHSGRSNFYGRHSGRSPESP